MPIYEYQCDACGFRKDFIQKMSDAPHTDCPECGKPELKKLVSAAAFRLKGGGWYETDFKQGDKKNLVTSDKKPEKSDSSKKSESKPAGSSSAAQKTDKS